MGVSWACQAVGYYHGLESVGACFSEDGSLLAVNFKTVSEDNISRGGGHCKHCGWLEMHHLFNT